MATPDSVRSRFQIDWLISNLRWLLLVSVALVGLIQPSTSGSLVSVRPYVPLILMLIVAALYNLFVMLLLIYGVLGRTIPLLTTTIDTALSIGFAITTGGINSPLLFFALFPIVTAALRFSWSISLLVAGVTVAGIGLIDIIAAGKSVSLPEVFTFLTASLVLLLATLTSGLVADRLRRALARKRADEEAQELLELRSAHQRSRLVFELASTLSASLNYDRVLQAVLDVAEEGMLELGQSGQTHLSAVLLFDENELRVIASRHLPQADHSVRFEGKAGVLGQAFETGEPVITDHPAGDPELSRFILMHSCRQAIVVPLRAGFENFGAVIFGTTQPDTYTEDHGDLLWAICNQAILALQNARLYESLNEEKERIVAVEEDARKKLSRDLHDGPTQSIAAIALRLNYIQTLLDKDPDQAGEEIATLEKLARQTTKEIRYMLFTLRPLILETQGLFAALKQYVRKLAEMGGRTEIRVQGAPEIGRRVDRNVQGVTFYIVEEAIGNAWKHAQANHIWVKLLVEDDTFRAEIVDDGCGFDLEAVARLYDDRSSLGMMNMKERAELINGQLSVSSAPDKGTRVVLAVPLRKAKTYG